MRWILAALFLAKGLGMAQTNVTFDDASALPKGSQSGITGKGAAKWEVVADDTRLREAMCSSNPANPLISSEIDADQFHEAFLSVSKTPNIPMRDVLKAFEPHGPSRRLLETETCKSQTEPPFSVAEFHRDARDGST